MNASILSGQNSGHTTANWRELGLRFFPHNVYLHQRFGSRVQKISLDGGFTCPNVDGTVATGGCTFCDNQSFSPSRRVRRDVITNQIESGIVGLRRRYSSEKFLAYFQPATNTYGSLEKLRTLYETALEDPRIVGLVIGTRPDCVADDVLDLIDEFAQRTYVSLELGVQTIHDASLVWMNRGHLHAASIDAMRRVAGRNFAVGMHVMLGLPGETHAMMMETAEQVAKWNPAGLKIHNLYAVHRTRLADQVARGEVRLLELAEYIELLADFIERLPPQMVIERISGDAPPKDLIAPQWCLDKGTIKQRLIDVLTQRDSYQGIKFNTAINPLFQFIRLPLNTLRNMTSTTVAPVILNVAAYKFIALDNLHERRAEYRQLCTDLDLRGTIMLSPEGINLFVAGEEVRVRHLLEVLRHDAAFEDIEVKESYSDSQPFTRMLVKLKREIIAFGIAEICPEKRTSPKLKATELRQWLNEGRQVRLLDTRNEYEIDLGTFRGAEQLHISHFRDFPAAISKLPEAAKREPLVMFCTGGIRCEKAGPLMEQAGFEQVYQLEGGILKYFEECGGEHYEGACFVFDGRVALDPELKPTGALQCFACQAVITHEDVQSPKFLFGKYCPQCYLTPAEAYEKQIARRQQMINKSAQPLPGSQPYDNYREIHVPGRLAGQTMLDFLDAWHPQTGREQWLSWLAQGMITAEEVAVTADRCVREGERFVQHLPNTTEPDVNSSIKLLHEDEFLVVVDKPAPLPVHASGRFNRNTLLYIVGQAYYPEKLRAAHRLDANTTGVVVLCRKYAASRYVQPQFAQQTVDKVYVARVHGHPAWACKTCDTAISASPEVHGSRNVDVDGQTAITELQVLERFGDGTSLLEVRPRTGRTNQIRVHLWDLGQPIVGDGLYVPDRRLGAGQTLALDAAPMCLHAWKLTVRHPLDKQLVTYEAPLPGWARQTVLP